jgi:hypothetical protein
MFEIKKEEILGKGINVLIDIFIAVVVALCLKVLGL